MNWLKNGHFIGLFKLLLAQHLFIRNL